MEVKDIIELIKKPKASGILSDALASTWKHKLHVRGDEYKKWLTDSKINSLQSERTTSIKEKICRPTTKRIFKGILNQQSKVFRAEGGVKRYEFSGDEKSIKEEFKDLLSRVAEGASLYHFMRGTWWNALSVDPMGVCMVELDELSNEEIESGETVRKDPIVVYYPIEYIHDVCVRGGQIEYLILSWKEKKGEETYTIYRYIDSSVDLLFQKKNDNIETYNLDPSVNPVMENPFSVVPAIQVSTRRISNDSNKTDTWICEAMEAADLYLSLSDDHTASVKLHQHPIFVSYPVKCPTCDGTGEIEREGETFGCPNQSCDNGYIKSDKADVAKGITVPYNQAAAAAEATVPSVPLPAAYITPDLASLEDQRTEMTLEEGHIEKAALGMEGLLEKRDKQETATGKELDMQSLLDQLNNISWNGETVEKFLTDRIGEIFSDRYVGSTIHWGRKYYVKSEGMILDEYKRAKESGANDSYLMELLEELTYTRFEHNDIARKRAMMLLHIEPYPTMTVKDVKDLEISDPTKLQFKMNLNDIVEVFEERHGNMVRYKEESQNQLQEVKKELMNIFNEMRGAEQKKPIIEMLGAVSPIIATKLIESVGREEILRELGIEVQPNITDNE